MEPRKSIERATVVPSPVAASAGASRRVSGGLFDLRMSMSGTVADGFDRSGFRLEAAALGPRKRGTPSGGARPGAARSTGLRLEAGATDRVNAELRTGNSERAERGRGRLAPRGCGLRRARPDRVNTELRTQQNPLPHVHTAQPLEALTHPLELLVIRVGADRRVVIAGNRASPHTPVVRPVPSTPWGGRRAAPATWEGRIIPRRERVRPCVVLQLVWVPAVRFASPSASWPKEMPMRCCGPSCWAKYMESR